MISRRALAGAMMIGAMMAVVALGGCGQKEEIDIYKKYAEEIKEMQYKIGYKEYQDAFQVFLNEGLRNGDVKKIDGGYIAQSLIDSTKGSGEVPELDYIETPMDSGADYIPIEEVEGMEYPIYNYKGEITSYGSREDSEKSLAEYRELPYYSIEATDAYRNFFLFKVWDKGAAKYKWIQADLNTEGKIDGYRFLGVVGGA